MGRVIQDDNVEKAIQDDKMGRAVQSERAQPMARDDK